MNSFTFVLPKPYSCRLNPTIVSLSSLVMALKWCSPLDGPITGLALWAGGPMTRPALYFKGRPLTTTSIKLSRLCEQGTVIWNFACLIFPWNIRPWLTVSKFQCYLREIMKFGLGLANTYGGYCKLQWTGHSDSV